MSCPERRIGTSRTILAVALTLAGACDPAPSAIDPAPPVTPELDARVARILERELENARANPLDARAHATLGLVYEANGLWVQAERSFAEAARLDRSQPLWSFHRALALRQKGVLDAALALLREVVRDAPDSAAFQHRLADMLLESGDAEGALEHFRTAAEIAPERAEGWAGMGAAHLARGEFAEARSVLERSLGRDPEYKHAHYLLGLALRGLGRNDEAKVELARGLDGKARPIPDELEGEKLRYAAATSSRLERALLLSEGGHPERALRILQRLAEAEPENVIVLNNLAATYMWLGDFEQALGLLRRANDLDDGRPLTWINMSLCLVDMGLARRGLEHAEHAALLAPQYAAAHAARARALAALEQPEEAHAAAARALELAPTDPEILRSSATTARKLGRSDEARLYYSTLVEIRPDDLLAWLELFELALAAGDKEAALEAAQAARRLAPEDEKTSEVWRRAKEL